MQWSNYTETGNFETFPIVQVVALEDIADAHRSIEAAMEMHRNEIEYYEKERLVYFGSRKATGPYTKVWMVD